MVYELTKWIHILAAITALGANFTYAVWIRRASNRPEVLPFTLKTVKLIDGRLANPAYAVLLISGLLMTWLADFPLSTPWLLSSLILYAAIALLGIFVYAPTFRRQIALAEQIGADSEEYRQAERRGNLLGIALVILTISIVFLMVVKPPLWG